MSQCLEMKIVTHNGISSKVPCAKCAFCLKTKREAWMFRIHHEIRTQELPAFFITLTYHPKFVRRVDEALSLRFTDLQKYFKRIRKNGYKLKYIAVGEYGSKTRRPHYHLLAWTDCPQLDIEKLWSTKKGELLGQLHFGQVTMASAMYVLKYIIQPKQYVPPGCEPTRAQFSKGLGLAYLTKAVYNYHTADYDNPLYHSRIDGKKVALPRYYRNKIFTKHQNRINAEKLKWQLIREHRAEMRVLIRKGIQDVNAYMKSLRQENAKAILRSTKFTQTL